MRHSAAKIDRAYLALLSSRVRYMMVRVADQKPEKDLLLHIFSAPNGSRTHVSSLEGWGNSRYTTGAWGLKIADWDDGSQWRALQSAPRMDSMLA